MTASFTLALSLGVLVASQFFTPTCPAYAGSETANPMTSSQYPATQQTDVVEDHFGQKVADPFRWLENSARSDKDVAAWVAAQDKVTTAYLATLPGRDIFKARLQQLSNYEQYSIPIRKGSRYFYLHKKGEENQRVLYVRESIDGEGRVLIDPNAWSKDGTTALAEAAPSEDGTRLAYGVQDGGTDWRTIRVLDVNTGKVLADEVKWARFTNISWVKDGSGFFYNRFPEPKQGAASQEGVGGHAIYFHAVGTPQAQDRLVYATPDQPVWLNTFNLTSDGRYLAIISGPGSLTTKLTVVDLTSPDWKPRKLVDNFDAQWGVIDNIGTKLIVLTTKDAPRLKIVTMDLATADPVTSDLVPEQDAILSGGFLVGGRLLLSYMVDATIEIRRYTLDGKADGVVPLPGVGTGVMLAGRPDDKETFFGFTGYNVAPTIFRYDTARNTARVWNKAKVPVDLDQIVVEQRFYKSKDGTRVPMFIVRRKDVTSPAPTLLYGYGGWAISEPPAFSSERLAWVEQGGVFASAHIRGGGEYGKPWHDAGRRQNKQNTFDDFIAAGEYLKAEGITSQDGLAIQGASNGGLLIGAVVNQRPDLFAAALAQVGVMDMLRFDQFTAGKLWLDEYGDPAKQDEFRKLFSYSPYHNVKSGKDYPAILATTADTDDRVVPAHTFKYVAALQVADIGPRPHLVRIETRAGHGAGKPADKAIAETADLWAFAAYWTGLKVEALK